MEEANEYRLNSDAFTPDTFPMCRLAQYMEDLANLLGEREHVHFVRLEEGSTVLVQRVDTESALRVQARVRAIRPAKDEGDAKALRAYRSLDRRLAEDNAVARLCGPDGAEIIRSPGREKPAPLTFGPFRQPGTLDGVLIKLGITKVAGATTIYSDDNDITRTARTKGITVIGIKHLPLPPQDPKLALSFPETDGSADD